MLFLLCKYFAWFFMNPMFRINDQECIKPGNIVVERRDPRHTYTAVYIVVSTLQLIELEQDIPSWFFYALYLGDFDMSHYPTPVAVYTSDLGIKAYANGHMNETNRSYLVPFNVSDQQREELIYNAKSRWSSLIKHGKLLGAAESPFL